HRPVILAISESNLTDSAKAPFTQLNGYTNTAVDNTVSPFVFDRTVKFGYKGALTYKIIVNWAIAEHKSQGTIQTLMNNGDHENFWYFKMNGDEGKEKTSKLFE